MFFSKASKALTGLLEKWQHLTLHEKKIPAVESGRNTNTHKMSLISTRQQYKIVYYIQLDSLFSVEQHIIRKGAHATQCREKIGTMTFL